MNVIDYSLMPLITHRLLIHYSVFIMQHYIVLQLITNFQFFLCYSYLNPRINPRHGQFVIIIIAKGESVINDIGNQSSVNDIK